MNEEFEKMFENPPLSVWGDDQKEFAKDVWDLAWQASRKQAVEECAKECDQLSMRLGDLANPSDCAEAIRALQKT